MVAHNRARRQTRNKTFQLFPVGFLLFPVGGLIPPYPTIARIRITSAANSWIGGRAFTRTVRSKSNNKIAIEAGAQWFPVPTWGARYIAIFGRAAHKSFPVRRGSFAAVPKFRGHNSNRGHAVIDRRRGRQYVFCRKINNGFPLF